MAVDQILGAISRTLVLGHRVEIRGFGSFSLDVPPELMRLALARPPTVAKGGIAG